MFLSMENTKEVRIAVIGVGYIGLPLAVAWGKIFPTIGFDVNTQRISDLQCGIDENKECSKEALNTSPLLTFTSLDSDIRACNRYIITVPTPINRQKQPDLSFLIQATKTVSSLLKKGDIVIFESTVFPGCTEEMCVPILEESSLKYNVDFFCGYSPERINVGDSLHTLQTITKVISGSSPEIVPLINDLYSRIVPQTYIAPDIKTAETAKVIENTQRDINIAFINEMAILCEKMGLDTQSVLQVSQTKWNFSPFIPGLVGGHCIGVDSYYLAYKAQSLGCKPHMTLMGRAINDSMGEYIVKRIVKGLIKKKISPLNAKILILGFAFKENCPDIRNTKVIDIIHGLESFGCQCVIYDPVVCPQKVLSEYGVHIYSSLLEVPCYTTADALVLAVSHDTFKNIIPKKIIRPDGFVFDMKSFFKREEIDERL